MFLNLCINKAGDMLKRKAFSLVEILLLVVIIGCIVGMVIPRLSGRSEQEKIMAAKIDITSNISTALKMFELDNGFFPTTEQGLDALKEKPTKSPIPKNWNGPYLEKEPLDPWGRTYLYKCPGTHGFAYDIYSLGRDDKEGENDITSWE